MIKKLKVLLVVAISIFIGLFSLHMFFGETQSNDTATKPKLESNVTNETQQMLACWVRDESDRGISRNGYVLEPATVPMKSVKWDKKSNGSIEYTSNHFKGKDKAERTYIVRMNGNTWTVKNPSKNIYEKITDKDLREKYKDQIKEFTLS